MLIMSAQSQVSEDPITAQNYDHVRRLLYPIDSHSDADDAVQDACLQFLLYRPAVKDEGEKAAWLLKAARHCLIDRSRHADVYACVPLSEMDAAPSHAAPSHAAPSHAAPSHAAPSHAAPSHAAPSHAAPSHAAPSHAAPSHAAPSHAAPESVVNTIVYGQILQSLPTEYRAVLELKAEGWTCAEMAVKLGLHPETAKKRFQRGRELLRKAMLAHGEPDPIR